MGNNTRQSEGCRKKETKKALDRSAEEQAHQERR